MSTLKQDIEDIWNNTSNHYDAIDKAMELLDSGELRIITKNSDGTYIINDYLKKAILLLFKHKPACVISSAQCNYYDKIQLKTNNWTQEQFESSKFRLVPGAIVRYSAHISKNVIIMPSFINVGAYIGEGTMIDSNATVGSCAQIGNNCHISDGVTIGGVLEPLQASPVIIEDNVFIGVRSGVTEGMIIREGAVLAPGTLLSASTKIYSRTTKEVTYGEIPAFSVVIPGVIESNGAFLYAAIIVKQVDSNTRMKTSINELLR